MSVAGLGRGGGSPEAATSGLRWEGAHKRSPWHVNCTTTYNHVENRIESPQKTTELPPDPESPLLGIYPDETITQEDKHARNSCWAQQVKNPTGIHEDSGSIPGLTQQVKDLALPQAVA